MRRIQTEVADLKGRDQGTEFHVCNKDTDTVMASCVKKADVQWEIHVVLRIMVRKHIQGVAKIIAAQVAVPSPARVIVGRNEASLYRGDDSSQEKQFLHCFFIMKREIPVRKGNTFHQFHDAGVPVGKLLPFGEFFRRFLILTRREKILPSQFLRFCFL